MGQTKAQVRRLLNDAFAGAPAPPGFSGRGVKSREFLDGVREDLITLIPEQFHFLVPRVLVDLLDHHTGEIGTGAEDVVGSLCRYWSGAPVDGNDLTAEAPAAGRSTAPRKPERDERISALLGMFTTEQAYAIRQWLIYARPWPEFDIYRHWVDEAVAIWSRGAGLAPPTDQELRAGAGRRIRPRRMPLKEAAAAGNLEEVRTLLQSGADVNQQDRGRNSALESAVTVGSTAIVRLLLEAGANPNIRNWDRATPLYSAAHMGNVEIAALLLSHGADVDAQDRRGDTPLSAAARRGNTTVADLLITSGADVNRRVSWDSTALVDAAANGHEAVVRLLTASGADVNVQSVNGITALMLAAKLDHVEVVRTLVVHGARVDVQDSQGRIAADYAHGANAYKSLSVLLAAGTD